MTEKEARKKWCFMSKDRDCKCIASACAGWVWDTRTQTGRHADGHCGLIK